MNGSLRMDTSGFNVGRLVAKVDAATPDALRAGAEHIGEVSAQLVPIEEGTLVRSQRIDVDAGQGQASISYNTPYARYQHERLDLRHEHGQPKFLEQPLATEAGTVMKLIAQSIRDAL